MMNDEVNVLADGVQPAVEEEIVDQAAQEGEAETPKEKLPDSVKKRLGQQEKKHKRDMRDMQDQLSQMQQYIMSQSQNNAGQTQGNAEQPAMQQPQQQQMQDPMRQLEMQRLEEDFNKDLERASDKYDDFDDIVSDRQLPFTQSLSNVLRVLDNPGDVIYALGKNLDELYRIAGLSQHSQAKELHKLSKALTMKEKTAPKVQPKVMGQLKGNSSGTKSPNDKPTVSDFRKMLRNGGK